MGLMKKVESDGLATVIENMKGARFNINSLDELVQELISINDYIQTQPNVSIEQIQNQLGLTFFMETRSFNEQKIYDLVKSTNLYSITRVSLPENLTKDECLTYLEQMKSPVIRICLQRILNSVQDKSIDLAKVSNQFYNQYLLDLFDELLQGSDELNEHLILEQVKEQLKKNKDLTDKIYRQMVKEKLITIDNKVKLDTEKKKLSLITNDIKKILNNKEDRTKASQLIDVLNKTDLNRVLPERVIRWYKSNPIVHTSSSKIKRRRNTRIPSVVETIKHIKEGKLKINTQNTTVPKSGMHETKTNVDNSLEVQSDKANNTTDTSVMDQLLPYQPTIITGTQDNSEIPIGMDHSTNINPSNSFTIRANYFVGKVEERQTFNPSLEQHAALLYYSAPTVNESAENVHVILTGVVPDSVNQSSYEKTKAQRILTKSAPSANITQSSLSNLQASSTQQTIPVGLIIRFELFHKKGDIRSLRLLPILTHHWIT